MNLDFVAFLLKCIGMVRKKDMAIPEVEKYRPFIPSLNVWIAMDIIATNIIAARRFLFELLVRITRIKSTARSFRNNVCSWYISTVAVLFYSTHFLFHSRTRYIP
jgi:hypothetical protein